MMSIKRLRRLGRCFGSDTRTKAGCGPLGFGRHFSGDAGAAAGLHTLTVYRGCQDPGSGSGEDGGVNSDRRQSAGPSREGRSQ